MKKTSLVSLAAAGVLLLGACGDDNRSSDTSVATADTTSSFDTGVTTDSMMSADTTAPSSAIVIEGAWARTSPMATTMGAAYMTLTSPIDDELVSASVDMSVAMEAQIHETITNTAGELEMRQVESVALKAGVPFELKPGGHHVMLMGLKAPLKVGTKLPITLTMKSGAVATVEADVLEDAPSM